MSGTSSERSFFVAFPLLSLQDSSLERPPSVLLRNAGRSTGSCRGDLTKALSQLGGGSVVADGIDFRSGSIFVTTVSHRGSSGSSSFKTLLMWAIGYSSQQEAPRATQAGPTHCLLRSALAKILALRVVQTFLQPLQGLHSHCHLLDRPWLLRVTGVNLSCRFADHNSLPWQRCTQVCDRLDLSQLSLCRQLERIERQVEGHSGDRLGLSRKIDEIAAITFLMLRQFQQETGCRGIDAQALVWARSHGR